MHCGWLPREKWVGGLEGVPKVGTPRYELDICPGWLARQVAVLEGAEAGAALRAGALQLYDPDNTNPVLEAAMTANQAFQVFESEMLADAARRNQR